MASTMHSQKLNLNLYMYLFMVKILELITENEKLYYLNRNTIHTYTTDLSMTVLNIEY